MIKVMDTFKSYIDKLAMEKPNDVEMHLNTWSKYIHEYPELEEKLKEDYTDAGIDWQKYAKEKIFNEHTKDLPKMREAYNLLKKITPMVIKRAESLYNINFDLMILYYVGLQNSAGWVDSYDNKRAILVGIDKIAQLNWHSEAALERLIAHELCHAIHFNIRGIDIVDPSFSNSLYDQGIWSIYEEGFAKFYEETLSNHIAGSRGLDWQSECERNEPLLKQAYLEALDNKNIGTRDFYGDWYTVEGLSDVGYYLGSRLVSMLSHKMDYKTIACLNRAEIEQYVLDYLKT